jgi:hypothetical protein
MRYTLLCDSEFNWTAIGSIAAIIAAVATCIYTFYTYQILSGNNRILEKNNKLAEYNIYVDISKRFGQEKTDLFIRLCSSNRILIESKDNENFPFGLESVSGNDFRIYVLDIFDDLYKFFSDDLISLNSINTGFGYYILTVGNCNQVGSYINRQREEYSYQGIHGGLSILYSLIYAICDAETQAKYKRSVI